MKPYKSEQDQKLQLYAEIFYNITTFLMIFMPILRKDGEPIKTNEIILGWTITVFLVIVLVIEIAIITHEDVTSFCDWLKKKLGSDEDTD